MAPSTNEDGDWFSSSVLEMVDYLDEVDEDRDDEQFEVAADILLDEFAREYDKALAEYRLIFALAYHRIRQRWGEAIEMLNFYIILNEQAGALFASMYDEPEGDDRFAALLQLHARACQVSREVLALLRAGYPGGAFARWRPIYEMAVAANFIEEHGQNTAKRFLQHRTIEDVREMEEYRRHHEKLGFEELDEQTEEDLVDLENKLVGRYEHSFKEDYGWADLVLENDEKPVLPVLARKVGIEEYLPYYRFASDFVHGGSKAVQGRLGLVKENPDEVVGVGPVNQGFIDPAQFTALMLPQVTNAFLGLEDEPYWEVISRVLEDFGREVVGAFVVASMPLKEMSRNIAEKITEEYHGSLLEGEEVEMSDEFADDIMEEVFGTDSES